MAEQLWYCNHFSRRYSAIRYKIDGDKLLRNTGFDGAWEKIEVEFAQKGECISVTVPAKNGVGSISFYLSKCDEAAA